jgi:ADP-ribose pyrophosphatase YjhB (NUDIX family)
VFDTTHAQRHGCRKGSQGSGSYALPGGHLEYLEDLEACAVRETLEETGLAVVNPRLEWVENCIFGEPENLQHYVTLFMRADLKDQVSLNPPHRATLLCSPFQSTSSVVKRKIHLPRSLASLRQFNVPDSLNPTRR